MTKATYKVGDKVRILDAENIFLGEEIKIVGGYAEVESVSGEGYPCLACHDGLPLIIAESELKYIEKVEDSDAKMTQFKVGDKVRIVNAKVISSPCAKINDGDIFEITGDKGGIKNMFQSRRVVDGAYLGINPGDVKYIELVLLKPTKNQRITTLEKEVETLKAEVEALKAAQKPPVTVIADAIQRYKERTPNEQRKAIIDEAKAFVKTTLAEVDEQMGWQTTSIPVYKECGRLRIEFITNAERRTIVALARYGNILEDPTVIAKGIAKCNLSDVFNADIGKAIALGRALGLDVSKFEKAMQPSEVVVGQVVSWTTDSDVVVRIDKEPCFHRFGRDLRFAYRCGWVGEKQVTITDDSGAKY